MVLGNSRVNTKSVCPVCGRGGAEGFFALRGMPVNVCVQWGTAEAAVGCPKGDITLAFCEGCGFVWNTSYDARLLDYSQRYENSLFFSAKYQAYTDALVEKLIGKYGLRGKTVIDIGCGKGDFLRLLCRMGRNRGVGFDTSYGERDEDAAGEIEIIRDVYSEKYAGYGGELVCSRYVFEHVERPRAFLKTVRKAIGDGGSVVYFEVPNVSLILKELSVWDIIYEHYGYFGASSLRRVFELCDFDVLDLYESYGGQFLGIEAAPRNGSPKAGGGFGDDLGEISREVEEFGGRVEAEVRRWEEKMEEIRRRGMHAVLWGAGAKGVTFSNMMGAREGIEYAVDINPRKVGKYVAGAGQRIVGPEFLRSYRPDCVILANPIYEREVRGTLKGLGLEPELVTT